jgi:hypothetical protein
MKTNGAESEGKRCFHCGRFEVPTPEGYCPSCTHRFKEAEEGQVEFPFATQSREPSPGLKVATKVAIAVFVFPTFVYLIGFLDALVLTSLCYLLPDDSQDTAVKAATTISYLAALAGSFVICKRFWPRDEPPVVW